MKLPALIAAPLAWIYGLIINVRHKLFDLKILRSEEFDIPVVCVGNLTVGGTGKTPVTEFLIERLSGERRVAVLSRGYRRRTKGFVLSTPRIADRRRLRIVQTPQVFRADLLRRAYEAEYRPEFTDDASVVEQAGEAVFLCEGERTNLKITTPEDMVIAEALLAGREKTEESADGENL